MANVHFCAPVRALRVDPTPSGRRLGIVLALALLATAPLGRPAWAAPVSPSEPMGGVSQQVAVYEGGLKNNWQDWGWAHRTLSPGQPARLNFSRYAGWILAQRNLPGTFASVSLSYRAPNSFGSFLELRLGAEGAGADDFPKVALEGTPSADGWVHVTVPMTALNPSKLAFDRVVLRAKQSVTTDDVLVDHVTLARGEATAAGATTAAKTTAREHLRIKGRGKGVAISPYIYGIAYSPRPAGKEDAPFAVGATVRRWGGNPASRYNFQLGNAWNTASDWFFQNVNYTNKADFSWRDFLEENRQHQQSASMTVPILGWMAKDTGSHSFSVAKMGPQKYSQGDAGNGLDAAGKPLLSPSPETTSVQAPPSLVGQWVAQMEAYQRDGHGGAIIQYILDNEPALWNSTHRDVHPTALTYDELLERTVAYGEAVRKAAPKANIAGPAEWGWPAYFFSAKDAEAGFRNKPDRRAHDDVPLLAWYLRELSAQAAKRGVHVLDTVDLHFYPQISGVYGHGENTSPQGAARRLRSTRSLWDPSYKDESWIADNIELLPRLKRLIAENYPRRAISIGEYNFGGERHISGGLAQAEALGRFGQGGVFSAYLWTYPPKGSFSAQAFLAYRNYDGQGASFLSQGLETDMADNVSLFASRNADGSKVTAILLNLRSDEEVAASIDLDGLSGLRTVRTFGFDADHPVLQARPERQGQWLPNKALSAKLPPYSLTVLEISK